MPGGAALAGPPPPSNAPQSAQEGPEETGGVTFWGGEGRSVCKVKLFAFPPPASRAQRNLRESPVMVEAVRHSILHVATTLANLLECHQDRGSECGSGAVWRGPSGVHTRHPVPQPGIPSSQEVRKRPLRAQMPKGRQTRCVATILPETTTAWARGCSHV